VAKSTVDNEARRFAEHLIAATPTSEATAQRFVDACQWPSRATDKLRPWNAGLTSNAPLR